MLLPLYLFIYLFLMGKAATRRKSAAVKPLPVYEWDEGGGERKIKK